MRVGPFWVSSGSGRRRRRGGDGSSGGWYGVLALLALCAVLVVLFYGVAWPALVLSHHRGTVRWGAEAAWAGFLLVVFVVGKRWSGRPVGTKAPQEVTGVIYGYKAEAAADGTVDVKFNIRAGKHIYMVHKAGTAVGNSFLGLAESDSVSALWHPGENRVDQVRKVV
jgi:hypothetical protein